MTLQMLKRAVMGS